MLLVYYDDEFEGKPVVSSVGEVLRKMFPDAHIPFQEEEIAPASSNTWSVACLMANYVRGSFRQLNHFQPLFCREEMGEDLWSRVAKGSRDKLGKKIEKCLSSLPGSDESEDEFSISAKDHLRFLERQAVFTDCMFSLGFHLGIVPADGNCALWSLLALEGGPVVKAQMSRKENVLEMRKESLIQMDLNVQAMLQI